MQNGDSAAPADQVEKPKEEVTKRYFRSQVWRHLETNGLSLFPRPIYNRIPNFKGAVEAANRLVELDIFKNAQTIKVNPYKPQEPVRILCLEHKKKLYVPVPRLQKGFLNLLEIPDEDVAQNAQNIYKTAVTRKGMENYGKPIGLEDNVSLDMMVMGSVAVSKEGYRIGKGRGYDDLEFGLLMQMKAIRPDTIIVTTVHDCQVFDSLPAELFGPHDVPIDVIVTPTQVIETQRMCQRPAGIMWHLLSNRRLQLMPVLNQLRDIELLAGRACTLKDIDTDNEDNNPARRRRRRYMSYRNKKSASKQNESKEGEGDQKTEGGANQKKQRSRSSNSRKQKPPIEFSVKISNITPTTRVRDLKKLLCERGVKPQIMVWKGFRGYCYLHYLKPNPKKTGVELVATSAEAVCTALEGLSIGDTPATVEPALPREQQIKTNEEVKVEE